MLEINQCDGCLSGLPIKNGLHYKDGIVEMGCTANRYHLNEEKKICEHDGKCLDGSGMYCKEGERNMQCRCWLVEETGKLPEVDKNGLCKHGYKVSDKYIKELQAVSPSSIGGVEEWEKEFDDKFFNEKHYDSSSPVHSKYQKGGLGRMMVDVKDFIRQTLLSQKQGIVEKIKAMQTPYPKDVFPELTPDEFEMLHNFCMKELGFPLDRVSGTLARLGWDNAHRDFISLIEKDI